MSLSGRERTLRRARGARDGARAHALPEQPRHQVLDLQRQVGNAAVARLIQRTPKDRPQSTDAPWVKRPKRKKPKKLEDIKGPRIIMTAIVDGKTRITIGSGPEQGIQVGMAGRLLSTAGGEVAGSKFTVDWAEGKVSKAFIDMTIDEVRYHGLKVVIKASEFISMEDKEF
jgi:hypothetical protein